MEALSDPADPIKTATVPFVSPGENMPSTGILPVQTLFDPAETPGSITITLVADDTSPADYQVSETINEQSATGSVLEVPGTSLTINSVTNSINEGEAAKFIITSSVKLESPLEIKYTPTDVAGTYLHATTNPTGDTITAPLMFIQRPGSTEWTAEISIATRNRDYVEQADGSIQVLLNPTEDRSKYAVVNPPSNTATVAVHDVDTPTISISDAPDTFIGDDATFTLTADVQPNDPLPITYVIEETTGSFLDKTNVNTDEEITGMFTFMTSNNITTSSLTLSTIDDPNFESGIISITITDDIVNTPPKYIVSSTPADRSAQVVVEPHPVVTIAFTQPRYTLSESVTRTNVYVMASENPGQTIKIFPLPQLTMLELI